MERRADPVTETLSDGKLTRKQIGSLRRGPAGDAIPVEVQASPVRDDRQQLLGLDSHAVAVTATVSIEISLCPVHAAEPGGLLRPADSAMYQAERQGRNRCPRDA